MEHHETWSEVWAQLKRRRLSAFVATILAAGPVIWKSVVWLVRAAGDMDFVFSLGDYRVGRFFLNHWEPVVSVLGILWLAWVVRPRRTTRARTEEKDTEEKLGAPAPSSLAPPEPTPEPVAPERVRQEPLVNEESFNQFRIYYSFCKAAVRVAGTFVEFGVCRAQRTQRESVDVTKAQSVLAAVVLDSHLPALDAARKAVQNRLPMYGEVPTQSHFRQIQNAMAALMQSYISMLKMVREVGDALLGEDQVLWMSGYALLYKYNSRVVEEVRRNRARSNWGRIVPAPIDLERILDLPRSREDVLASMSALEIVHHAKNGFHEDLVGRHWAVWVTLESVTVREDGRLDLSGRVKEGIAVHAKGAQLADDEKAHMTQGRKVTLQGTVESIGEGIELSPGSVGQWESG